MTKEIKFEQKLVEIEGVEYTLQKPGIEERIKIRSKILNAGDLSQFVAYKEYLGKVVVSPKREMTHFEDNLQALDKLMAEVESFLFREDRQAEKKSENSKEK